jgi:DNA-binding transcriptional LysR family regulator
VDIRQLRYFLAVADELHFGRAAARIHIAQPALSQQIRSLEAELGLQLLERGARGVRLTEAGARLRAEAEAVVARFDAALATMTRVRDGALGAVRVGVFSGPVRMQLPAMLAELRARHPELEVLTRQMPSRAQELALRDGALDVALLPWEPAQPLEGRVIDRQRLGVALPAGHPLAAVATVAATELSSLPMVWMGRSSDPDIYDAILAKLDAAGGRPAALLEATTPESSLSIVAAGVATSLKTQAEVEQAAATGDRVVWRPLEGVELEIATVVAWDPSRPDRGRDAVLAVLAP